MQTTETFLAQFDAALDAARLHARDKFPEEACGLIVDFAYIPCENTAANVAVHDGENPDCPCKLCAFRIAPTVYLRHAGKIQAVVHSHPNGPDYPSASDMRGQESSALTWIIIPLDEARFAQPVVWGGAAPVAPLLGRTFRHGVTDCYDLIHDAFAAGKDALASEGIEGWPFDPIHLPTYPREDGWWEGGRANFYEEEPEKIGFVEINMSEARPGDVFLCKIRSDRLNHGGLLIGNGLILHHLPNRLSRREPAGLWAYSAEKWIRYVGVKA
jgi:proteasome lid subunit RPN8/RPN11